MAEVQRSSLTRVIASSLIGTTIEWYDFFLYGSAAALVFNKLFFPSFDPLVGTLLAFATYAVGFVARPLGGIVFGHFGDRIGRKQLLMWSLVMMGARDRADRAAAGLRQHRRVGADRAHRAARVPGLRGRRRMGRRGADGRRARRRQAARLLGELAAGGRSARAVCSRPESSR